MHLIAAAATIWLIAALFMGALWAWSRRWHRLAYFDVAWAGLMAAAALFAGVVGDGTPLVRFAVATFGSLWAARLCLHLLHRRLSEDAEDGRLAALREAWAGRDYLFFAFFQLQAVMVMLFSLPLLAAAGGTAPHLDRWVVAAGAIWAVALVGEMVADRQLARFRDDPSQRGRTLRRGLWAWTRHPNYFFEWLHWFAYLPLAATGPHGWLAFTGPVLMFAFLVHRGIPWSEAQALRSRGDDYRLYQREVGAFFPRPPRQSRR